MFCAARQLSRRNALRRTRFANNTTSLVLCFASKAQSLGRGVHAAFGSTSSPAAGGSPPPPQPPRPPSTKAASNATPAAAVGLPVPAPSTQARREPSPAVSKMRFIDIGANLLDEMYGGRYNDKDYHSPDLSAVLQRAWTAGLDHLIITAGSLTEARKALELARTDARLYCTVGCHPTRCGEFESHPGGPGAYLQELLAVLREGQAEGKVVAVGECGLDYDRLHFCDAETQKKYFAAQFALARESGLPMFLHLRAAADDFLDMVRQHAADFPRGGVVHSFDGTADEARRILELPLLDIGLNGCSLKTEDNLAVVAGLPLERIMIETDCPWCEIRPTHAGRRFLSAAALSGAGGAKDRRKYDPAHQVKSRNEPANIRLVLEVIAGVQGLTDLEALAERIYDNTAARFFPGRGRTDARGPTRGSS